jgi:putative phosphoesterase
VIADTHGYLHPAILEIFAGVDHIIHAGDIMDGAILAALQKLAPLTAVAGNLDGGELAEVLPREVLGETGGITFAVGHKRKRLLKRLATGRLGHATDSAEPCLVVFGHEHAPSASWVDGVLYLNPGTATAPDEEDDAATVALVESAPAGLSVTFVPVPRRAAPPSSDS